MIRRLCAVFLAALAGLGMAAVPALANGPVPVPGAGCSGGTCDAYVGVTVDGPGKGPGNSSLPTANVPPPLCWYSPPTMNAVQMYQFLLQWEKGTPGSPPIIFTDWPAIVAQIQQQHKQNPPPQGLWYELNGDLNNPAAKGCLATYASFVWVPQGQFVPQPAITPQDLALYALSFMTVPKPKVTLSPNPPRPSDVNLPTFVKIAAPRGAQNGELWVTATLHNPFLQVTVAVKETGVGLDPGGNGTAYTAGCGPEGSSETPQQMNAATVGTTPDCGVVYRQPSAGAPFTLAVTQTWTPTAYQGGFVPGRTGNLLPAAQSGPIQSLPQDERVPVREIQSTNG